MAKKTTGQSVFKLRYGSELSADALTRSKRKD